MRCITLCVAWLCVAGALHAQRADPRIRAADQADFLVKANAAAAAFIDQEAALLDGYRPIGPELPAMGQHWLNPEYANLGYADPARPAFLLYVTIDGKPKLGGIGYVLALKPGDSLPDLPAGRSAWHAHSGSIADEAFAIAHDTLDDAAAFRVIALHIWHALPSPHGMFSVENWGLPFLRNGLDTPAGVDLRAARLLGLTFGGDAHATEVIARHMSLTDIEKDKVAEVLAHYRAAAQEWAHQRRGRAQSAAALVDHYNAMWIALDEALPPPRRAELNRIRELWAPRGH